MNSKSASENTKLAQDIANGIIYDVIRLNDNGYKYDYYLFSGPHDSNSINYVLNYFHFDGTVNTGFIRNGSLSAMTVMVNKTTGNLTLTFDIKSQLDGEYIQVPNTIKSGWTTAKEAFTYIKDNYALKSELPEDELPAIAAGDAGKVLAVNSTEDDVEWITPSGGSTYTAGNGIDITNDEISVDTSVIATKSDLAGKQNTLTPGSGITIQNDVISATGGGGSINIDNQTIINDNGTYKTAVGGYVSGSGQATTYVSGGSASTTRIIAENSTLTNNIQYSNTVSGSGVLYVSYTMNILGQTYDVTNQPFNYETNRSNIAWSQGGGYGPEGWVYDILHNTDSNNNLTGIWGMAFQGGSWSAGDTVSLDNLVIGTTSGGTDIYDGTGSTITFNNGIQPGSGSLVLFPSVVPFQNGQTFSCSSGEDTSFTLSGHIAVYAPEAQTPYEDYDFSDTFYFTGGGNTFTRHSSGMSHTVEVSYVGLNVSSFTQNPPTWNFNGISGLRFDTNGSQGDNSTTVLTNLTLSMGGSVTYIPIDSNFIPIAFDHGWYQEQDGRWNISSAPMYNGHLVVYDTNHQNGWYLTSDGNTITLNPCPWNSNN